MTQQERELIERAVDDAVKQYRKFAGEVWCSNPDHFRELMDLAGEVEKALRKLQEMEVG
jgi:hypothetical protein